MRSRRGSARASLGFEVTASPAAWREGEAPELGGKRRVRRPVGRPGGRAPRSPREGGRPPAAGNSVGPRRWGFQRRRSRASGDRLLLGSTFQALKPGRTCCLGAGCVLSRRRLHGLDPAEAAAAARNGPPAATKPRGEASGGHPSREWGPDVPPSPARRAPPSREGMDVVKARGAGT